MIRPITKTATHSLMERMISELLSNSRAWAFREPVNVEEVVDYLEFIKDPMGMY
jgi:Bromodomain